MPEDRTIRNEGIGRVELYAVDSLPLAILARTFFRIHPYFSGVSNRALATMPARSGKIFLERILQEEWCRGPGIDRTYGPSLVQMEGRLRLRTWIRSPPPLPTILLPNKGGNKSLKGGTHGSNERIPAVMHQSRSLHSASTHCFISKNLPGISNSLLAIIRATPPPSTR